MAHHKAENPSGGEKTSPTGSTDYTGCGWDSVNIKTDRVPFEMFKGIQDMSSGAARQ